MGQNNRAKKHKPKLIRPGRRKVRQAARSHNRTKSDAHQLDNVSRDFDRAVEALQGSLERLRESVPELVALGVQRDRLQRIKVLAEDGILDSLQRLAAALEGIDAAGDALPASVAPFRHAARMAIDHFCRAFEIQAFHQPGESLTVTQEQANDFNWSADSLGSKTFPTQVEILRSGWKAGDAVFVLPRVRGKSA